MGATIQCADCGTETPQRHPLSTRCRPCHHRRRRPIRRRKWSEKYGNRATWNKKSRKIREEIGACELCGSTQSLTVDHIIERAMGGTNARSNLQVLCDDCHQAKTREFNRRYCKIL